MDGKKFEKLNFGFEVKRNLVIAWDQSLSRRDIKDKVPLFHSPIFKIFILLPSFIITSCGTHGREKKRQESL